MHANNCYICLLQNFQPILDLLTTLKQLDFFLCIIMFGLQSLISLFFFFFLSVLVYILTKIMLAVFVGNLQRAKS